MEAKNQIKKKTQLSIIIREPVEKLNRSGVNCIRYEQNSSPSNKNSSDRLFTAGRDAVIRVYSNLAVSAGTNLVVPPPPAPTSSTSSSSSMAAASRSASDIENSAGIDKYYQMSFSHHSDWVNDIVVCRNTKTVFSASSDTTVKLWNSTKGTLLHTLRLHKDYVKCLAYAKDKQLLASAGFDKNIFIWDVSTGTALNPNGLDVKSICDSKYSIYSMSMTSQASLLACGSPENCIRLWDPRSCSKVMKLKGHTHNIRSLVLNRDGTQILSASSDNTVRLWSLAQQRCIYTIEAHSDGVWALCVNDAFNKVYSGGKDCRVYATDLRSQEDSVLVCEENAPILSLDFGYEQESLWISTTNSSIKNWSVKASMLNTSSVSSSAAASCETSPGSNQLQSSSASRLQRNNNPSPVDVSRQQQQQQIKQAAGSSSSSSSMSSSFLAAQVPLNTQPVMTIRGMPSIKQYHILNDKRFIVTKDTDDNVCVWDVLQARKTESLGKENYEQAIKVRQRFISIPNWFTVDLKLGVLTINIDESEWQSAWINFKDMDSNHVRQSQHIDLSEARVNYGYILLESLFKTCTFVNPSRLETCTNVVMPQSTSSATAAASTALSPGDEATVSSSSGQATAQPGLLRFSIPEHTPVVFSEVAGRCLYRLEVRDMSKDAEQQPLANVMPSWIVDALFGKTQPKFNRINFILNPYNPNQIKLVSKDRLISYDLLQVKKVKEYVYSKILKLDQTSGQQQQLNESTNTMGNNQQLQNDTNNNYKTSEVNQNNYDKANNIGESSSSSSSSAGPSKDTISNAQRIIELICSDQILNDPEMNLRTVKHLIWKGNGDLTILFRVKT